MSFNINTIIIRDDLTNLLKNNLASINAGITKPISSTAKITNVIYAGFSFPFNAVDLPEICVYQVSKNNEEFNASGGGGRKAVEVTFEIAGVVRIVKSSKIDTRYIDDVVKMANNIDYIMRNNIGFSASILRSNPQSYEIRINDLKTGTYVCTFTSQIICQLDVVQCG